MAAALQVAERPGDGLAERRSDQAGGEGELGQRCAGTQVLAEVGRARRYASIDGGPRAVSAPRMRTSVAAPGPVRVAGPGVRTRRVPEAAGLMPEGMNRTVISTPR